MRDQFLKDALEVLSFSKSSKAAFILVLELFLGFSAVVVGLLLFSKFAEDVIAREVLNTDTTIIHFVYQFRNPFLTELMKAITLLGGQTFLGSAIIVTIVTLILRRHRKDAFLFSFILFFGIVLNIILKFLFHRPRPMMLPLVHETSYSFPSAHSMNSFVFYMALSYFIFKNTKSKELGLMLSFGSAIIIGLVGLSRIYLGAHFPSDVIAGYIAGGIWFAFVLLVEKTLLFLKLFKKFETEKKY